MRATIFEITPCPQGRLATMARPRGGDWLGDELASLKTLGVSDLVSLLTPQEEAELDLTAEPQSCAGAGLRFHSYPIPDRGLPLQPAFSHFIDLLLPILTGGGFIAIHCRAGIGRSSVTAAALLCRLGVSAPLAISLISKARRLEIPDTDEQRAFILSFDNGNPQTGLIRS
jgi:protein-tyrosine phosphatase